MERVNDQWAASGLQAERSARKALEGAEASKSRRDQGFVDKQKELENEARKGTDDGVGPGVSGVLERMREQQATGHKATR
jgi:hypothetical protein